MTTTSAPAPTKRSGRGSAKIKLEFAYAGETVEPDAEEVARLLQEYGEAATQLREAKDRCVRVETAMKLLTGGHEALLLHGEEVVTWKWVDSTSFDIKAARDESPQAKAFIQRFMKTKPARRFKVRGVEGVDV